MTGAQLVIVAVMALGVVGMFVAELIERAVEELSGTPGVKIAYVTAAQAIDLFRIGGFVLLMLALVAAIVYE